MRTAGHRLAISNNVKSWNVTVLLAEIRVYLVPLLIHSASNVGVTLKSELKVTQGRLKWYHSKA